MAYLRKRHILEPFQQILKFARITGVIGHRQTGKSTFVEANSSEYCTLDDKSTLERAKNDAAKFIRELSGKKSAIDECQLVPDLFPALKVKIGTSSIPGRFILTGSVRFSSRNAIRESLTGRIINQEMLPLVLTELCELKNSNSILKLFDNHSLSGVIPHLKLMGEIHREYKKAVDQYLSHGGLPAVCFVRSAQIRNNLLRDILETVLDRDIRLIYPTTVPLEHLKELCRFISQHDLQSINYQEVYREIGLTPSTTKKILNAMESVFLIRRISLIGDYRGDIFYFEDQLERHYFNNDNSISSSDWLGLFYRNVRAQFTYRVGEFVDYFCYRTRGGAEVPLVIRSKNKYLGFIMVKNKDEITRSMISSAESFLKKYDHARVIFVLIDQNHAEVLTERMAMVSITSLLF